MIGEKAADEWVARMAYLKPPGWERVETGSSRNVDWLVVTREGGVLRSFGRIMSREGGKGREGRRRRQRTSKSRRKKRRREKDCKMGMCKLEVDDDFLSRSELSRPRERDGCFWILLISWFSHPLVHPHPLSLLFFVSFSYLILQR